MARPETELLSPKEQRKMEVREGLDDFHPTAEKLEELKPKRNEDTGTFVNRIVWFSLQQTLLIALTTLDEALAAKLWMHVNTLGVTPKAAIDISVRRSPVDDMDDEELLTRMVERLLENPVARKMLEDKLKGGEKNK